MFNTLGATRSPLQLLRFLVRRQPQTRVKNVPEFQAPLLQKEAAAPESS